MGKQNFSSIEISVLLYGTHIVEALLPAAGADVLVSFYRWYFTQGKQLSF